MSFFARGLSAILFALACIPSAAAGQDGSRTLHWRRLDVEARIEDDGRLRVRERQAMVFTGDWNGGERTFKVPAGQRIDLHSIKRIDANGNAHMLERGSLDDVDHYDWTDGNVVRWRSRLPGDPLFQNQEIIYELDYTLTNILVAQGDAAEGAKYALDHDFAFPDRVGVIESYSLVLDASAMWRSATALPLRVQRQNMQPGESVHVDLALQYAGAGRPSGVQHGVALTTRVLLVMILLTLLARMLRTFFTEERARGRFEPLTPVDSIDEAWLNQHVFKMPPEVVGAMWDNTTSAPEVAAMIARMVLEGKLVSRVEPKRFSDVLHLELKVRRGELSEDERVLVNALFPSGKDSTDTESIKERYSSSGFNPASLISEGIKKQINALAPARAASMNGRHVMINTAVVLLVVAAGASAIARAGGSAAVIVPIAAALACLIALVHAISYRSHVIDTRKKARRMVLFLLVAVSPIAALALGLFERGAALSVTPLLSPAHIDFRLLLTLIVMFIGLAFLVLKAARTPEDADRLKLRRTLAAGRAFFIRELKQPKPSLDDAWYPYLLAFGLGKHVDKWFRAFGGSVHDSTTIGAASGVAIASGSSSGWSGGGPQFGGGGFGGGGAGRNWGTAVTAMSAGVAAPSSSSSDGGGGGSSSSGGGGGGGW